MNRPALPLTCSVDCSYDQPSNRRRNPAPQYIEALEVKLRRAEALLKTVLPNVDLNNPDLDPVALQRPDNLAAKPGDGICAATGPVAKPVVPNPAEDQEREAMLESMIDATGQLHINDQGYWDFHGHSSGYTFLHRLRQQFGDLLGPAGKSTPFIKTRPMSQVFDSPRSTSDSATDSTANPTADLPPKEVAKELVRNTLDDCCALMRFVHQPSFYDLFDRVYGAPYDHFTEEEHRFLPLLYVVLAVGCVFAKTEQSDLEKSGYENAIEQGYELLGNPPKAY